MLKEQDIELLIDVRSKPYSRFRHFNREPLRDRLFNQGVQYLHLGDQLGGHPESRKYYEKRRVVYERLATLPEFRKGINRVIEESETHRLALMCTEEDPLKCHRDPLLASALMERGVQILHIRRNGLVQDAKDTVKPTNIQIPLLETGGEDLTWLSPKIIRQRESD